MYIYLINSAKDLKSVSKKDAWKFSEQNRKWPKVSLIALFQRENVATS
jgi:hypothetical protein